MVYSVLYSATFSRVWFLMILLNSFPNLYYLHHMHAAHAMYYVCSWHSSLVLSNTHYHTITLPHYHTNTLSHYHTITLTHYHTNTLSHISLSARAHSCQPMSNISLQRVFFTNCPLTLLQSAWLTCQKIFIKIILRTIESPTKFAKLSTRKKI